MTRPYIPNVKGDSSLQEISEVVVSWFHASSPDLITRQTKNWRRQHWDAACWNIWLHGIGPLLYGRLSKGQILNAFPDFFWNYLTDQYRLNGQRISMLKTELSKILRMAENEGIEIAPLKGSILIYHYYKEPALRPMSDLDLLIHPSDSKKLDELLLDSGYKILEAMKRHRVYVPSNKSRKGVYQGEHPDNPWQIEIHNEIYESFCGKQYNITDRLWDGCSAGMFGKEPGMLMRPANLLMHLLFHTSGHIYINASRFMHLYDISLVGSRLTAGEWEHLTQIIGCESHILYTPLLLVKKYIGWSAPSRIMEELASKTPNRLKTFLKGKTISYFSYCNIFPIWPSDKLRWCPNSYSLMFSIFRMLSPAQIWHNFLWFLRMIMGLSRYFSFSFIHIRRK